MGWQASLMFTGCGFGLASVATIWACDYFSLDQMRARQQRRLRKQRVKAMRYLRSTAARSVYNEFESARKL